MNQIEYIGAQVRRYRKEKGWTAAQLGQMIEPQKTESAITSWERGRTQPDGDVLIQLCRLFEVEIADFYYDPPEYEDKNECSWVEVPYFGYIAAGEPIEMIDREETYLVPASIAKKHPNAGVLVARGNSWNREIPDGYCVVVDFDLKTPENEHEPFAVCIDGETATVKSIQKLENGVRLLPNSYDETIKPIVFDYDKDGESMVTTLGKVVWAFAPFDYSF